MSFYIDGRYKWSGVDLRGPGCVCAACGEWPEEGGAETRSPPRARLPDLPRGRHHHVVYLHLGGHIRPPVLVGTTESVPALSTVQNSDSIELFEIVFSI